MLDYAAEKGLDNVCKSLLDRKADLINTVNEVVNILI